ncbi:Galactosylgalactosylxylosylprotein 3-beta-glucuronosyltransferase 1 [Hypsibius exemplaris]|uniref:Galactosylgalactosylxylosylprotein 3-beta-glucuronosyltransferase n=1 Tax=Hypsibius exemplaris TaxID=2072580 RepID=A0A1W0X405_HYPEX|nr:Galactosylgalactosylxylosylprotein 3-beta-glucuronosyltransferase 1 [Hypsibius exemplaris]
MAYMPSADETTVKQREYFQQFLHFRDSQMPETFSSIVPSSPTIFLITPTYARHAQKSDLTRLVHTFKHVENLFWIVVEDASDKSDLVAKLLRKSGLRYAHLNVATPKGMKIDLASGDKQWSKPRGVWQRNEGLRWLRETFNKQAPVGNSANQQQEGVVYFADDDNTYDLDLFPEIRTVRTAGVWPVAFVGELLVEKPIVVAGIVTGWDVAYKPDRPFAVDMAGFAVNLRLVLQHPHAGFDDGQPVGYQETYFLRGLGVTLPDLEPKAGNCSEVLVWHTRTEKVNVFAEKRWNARGKFSAGGMEF